MYCHIIYMYIKPNFGFEACGSLKSKLNEEKKHHHVTRICLNYSKEKERKKEHMQKRKSPPYSCLFQWPKFTVFFDEGPHFGLVLLGEACCFCMALLLGEEEEAKRLMGEALNELFADQRDSLQSSAFSLHTVHDLVRR